MKLNIVKAVSIAGLLFLSPLTQAAPAVVIDTFVVGQPLTAAQMNNIKALVEYNQSGMFFNRSLVNSLESEPATTVTTVVPTTDDGINSNYRVGTVWVDTIGGEAYISTDDTSGAAVWKLITHAPAEYAIGDIGPAGGIVFYITADGLHGLEAAPSDQNGGSGIRWDNASGPATNTSAIGDGVGAGAMNTMLIIANQGADSSTYAAGIAANLVITHSGVDYGDWYLPSKFELNLMWLNLADPLGDGRVGVSDTDSVGGFASNGYWSSLQYDSWVAWGQNFGDGGQVDDGTKSVTLRVRAVRAF